MKDIKVPTAEEFYKQTTGCVMNHRDIKIAMIEFAKLHVNAALKKKVIAMKKQREEDSSYDMNELDAFTYDAYPLNLIK